MFSVAKIRITKYKKYGYDDAAYMIEVKDILKVNKKKMDSNVIYICRYKRMKMCHS